MNAWVVEIGELIQDAPLALGRHVVGQVSGIFHAPAFGRQDEFGAKGLHGLRTLNGQIFRHDQNHSVTPDGRTHGKCNARVTRGGFNQGVARLDFASLFSPFNHGKCGPVFD